MPRVEFRDPSTIRVTTVGGGYVGLVTAVGMAARGHHVTIVETDAARLSELEQGRLPIREPGLDEAFAEATRLARIDVTDTIPAAGNNLIMVCVGTPIDEAGEPDLAQLWSAFDAVGPSVAAGASVVVRSTLPVGTSAVLADRFDLPAARLFTNPEFLRQGQALEDFLQPSRIVIGRAAEGDEGALAGLLDAYKGFDAPIHVVGLAEAEVIKNGANAFLALKLSLVNELATLCEEYGADIGNVIGAIGSDPRIGKGYMAPSFGFGGSCLPKELRTLAVAGRRVGLPMLVTTAASDANLAHQQRFARRIAEAVGQVDRPIIGLLGLAFKADTDDVRSSPALGLARELTMRSAHIQAYDPLAAQNAIREFPTLQIAASVREALDSVDVAVIATDWPEFREIDWPEMRLSMRQAIIADGRRMLDASRVRGLGFRYLGLGQPDTVSAVNEPLLVDP